MTIPPLKAVAARLGRMLFGRSGWGARLYLPGADHDYARAVGDRWRASAAAICLSWLARNAVKPDLRVCVEGPDGEDAPVEGHPLVALLDRPNPHYSYTQLLKHTILWYGATGNAYWVKIRSRAGLPVQLWPVPNPLIEPIAESGTALVDCYRYRPMGAGGHIDLPPSEVVHFRDGIDPDHPACGLSPLQAQDRELFTDNAIGTMVAALARNMGVPGLLVCPADGGMIPEDQAEVISDTLWERTTGENRGKPLVSVNGLKAERLSWSPREMMADQLRAPSAERICAALGLNAMAVNLPSDSKTYSNYGEAIRSAWNEGMLPLLEDLAETLYLQLLPDFPAADSARERVLFDTSKVPALADDQDKLWDRITKAYKAEIIKRSVALGKLGLPSGPEDDVYYVGAGVQPDIPPAGRGPEDTGAAERVARAGAKPARKGTDLDDLASIQAAAPTEAEQIQARALLAEATAAAGEGADPLAVVEALIALGADRLRVEAEALAATLGAAESKALAADLAARVRAWRDAAARLVRRLHLAAALALGGRNLTPADAAIVARTAAQQSSYLDRFAAQLIAGEAGALASLVSRAASYAGSAWGAAQAVARDRAGRDGYVEERRVLNPGAKSCAACPGLAALDWQPLDSLPEIGDTPCMTRCRCHFEYR